MCYNYSYKSLIWFERKTLKKGSKNELYAKDDCWCPDILGTHHHDTSRNPSNAVPGRKKLWGLGRSCLVCPWLPSRNGWGDDSGRRRTTSAVPAVSPADLSATLATRLPIVAIAAAKSRFNLTDKSIGQIHRDRSGFFIF